MRIYDHSELLVHTTPLGKSGIGYRQFWILDYKKTWYPERVLELILVGKEAYPLKNTILPIRLPRIKGMQKREIGVLVDGEVRRQSAYLARIGILLSRQLKAYIQDEPLPYGPKKRKEDVMWIKIHTKYAFLAEFLAPPDDTGEDAEKPP